MKPSPPRTSESRAASAPIRWRFAVSPAALAAIVVLCGMWLATACALSTRIQLVFEYSTLPMVPPELEVIAVAPRMLIVLAGFALMIAMIAIMTYSRANIERVRRWWSGTALMTLAQLPLGALVLRAYGCSVPAPSWWEPWWLALASGGAVLFWVASLGESKRELHEWASDSTERAPFAVLVLATMACGVWWCVQSYQFWQEFQLGFNDFGHFALRVIHTQRGHGWLMESPVLPPFWDHFNPGLLLLVPIAWAFPNALTIFAIQAACLSGSSWMVYGIARALGLSKWTAAAMGLGWLLLPSLGQMNVAYTYGWHPISLAIPCMLASYWAWLQSRPWLAGALTVLAVSFEEGVFVAIGCFAAMMTLRELWIQRRSGVAVRSAKPDRGGQPWRMWLLVWLVATIGFVVVYRWSGLAEFQTGRFARLGSTPLQILFSPILRTPVFFELLMRPRNLAFVSLLLGPFVFFAGSRFAWSMLATALPLLVLVLWEHMPAQSIAFQYPSTLLPVWVIGAMHACADRSWLADGESRTPSLDPRALGWVLSGLVLGVFVGQMPWSVDSLIDVKAKTYGIESHDRRDEGSLDQRWLLRELAAVRSYGSGRVAFPDLRVLATGRIAAHCLGAKDLETVGQFWQRYEALKALDSALPSPILRYDWIAIDHRESFQQTREETARVRSEALKHGFQVIESKYGIEVLVAPSKAEATSR